MNFGGNDKPIKHDQAARKRFNSNFGEKKKKEVLTMPLNREDARHNWNTGSSHEKFGIDTNKWKLVKFKPSRQQCYFKTARILRKVLV